VLRRENVEARLALVKADQLGLSRRLGTYSARMGAMPTSDNAAAPRTSLEGTTNSVSWMTPRRDPANFRCAFETTFRHQGGISLNDN
jgi:hypothetical protein